MSARPFETHNHAANAALRPQDFQFEIRIQATDFSE
jgi:hypothetical protein